MRQRVQTNQPCPHCEGTGRVSTGIKTLTYDPETRYQQDCLSCEGGGRVIAWEEQHEREGDNG